MFADLMLVLSMAAAVALLLIVVVLTRPIAVLRKYTSRFSRGEYNIRLAISGHDELAELGHDFNAMAEAVEKNILSLRQMNEERTRFIDNLTHEIRSPLTSIIGFADLMRQAPELSREERVRQSEYIYKEGRHLQNISRLLMELTLLGQADFELEAVDLFDLLEETSLLSEPVMKKYQTILELENEHGFVNVNLELFRSLLSNLIENAGKASQPGDTIILRGKAVPSGGMRLTVQDSGCGIPKEELKKIRQPFYVLDKARTRSSGGAGLGLALCDEIARIHGSELIIESEIGRGTAVSLLFSPVQEVIDDDAFSK
jgi:signal transduction histidine kinase